MPRAGRKAKMQAELFASAPAPRMSARLGGLAKRDKQWGQKPGQGAGRVTKLAASAAAEGPTR